jgi:hypothetical protein
MKCTWHICGQEFAPGHYKQIFCSESCRQARAAWRQRRGSALVDPLINMDTAALAKLRAQLIKEIGK